jgi:HD-like signal output (HDOD) protein
MSPSLLDEQEIRFQISKIKELPPLPKALQRLIEIIYNEVESSSELESIIAYDQALTAKIFRIANSTLYGYRGKVSKLSKAMVILGLSQTKSICLFTLFMSLLSNGASVDPVQREHLWKHAFATSRIATIIAKKRPLVNHEEAGILGLIHDIGRLVMAIYFSEQFKTIMAIASKRRSPPWCVETERGLSHTQFGKYVALRWAFPESFQAVIEFHHSPERCGSFRTETMLVYLANVLSNSLQYPELLSDETTLSCCKKLYIPEEEWQEYQHSLEHVWPEVDQLWNLLS